MTAVLLLARVALAAVFAVAGAAKLADRAGSREALSGFGVPARLVAPLAVALPLAELALAAALLPAATAPYAAVAAVALTVVFLLAILRALRAGRAPDCHCFGQLHSAPAGRGTMLRNGLLAALAAAVAVDGLVAAGGAPAFGELELSGRTAAVLGGSVAFAVLAAAVVWFGFELLRQNGRLIERLDRLEDERAASGASAVHPLALQQRHDMTLDRTGDAAAPAAVHPHLLQQRHDMTPDGTGDAAAPPAAALDLTLAGLDGAAVPLTSLGDDRRPVVLVFSDPSCGPCRALLPEIAAWERELEAATIVLVSGDESAADARAHAQEHGIERLLLDHDDAVSDALRVPGTPSAVLLDAGHAAPPAAGAKAIRELIASLDAPVSGSPAGAFLQLHHIAGREPDGSGRHTHAGEAPGDGPLHAVAAHAGAAAARETLLLFWNPACGFCARIGEELRALDRRAAANDGPRLVVVSSAPAEENAALGLTAAEIVNDEGFALGHAFGAAGTPSAVVLGADGRVAAPVAVGGDAVLALAGPLPAGVR